MGKPIGTPFIPVCCILSVQVENYFVNSKHDHSHWNVHNNIHLIINVPVWYDINEETMIRLLPAWYCGVSSPD